MNESWPNKPRRPNRRWQCARRDSKIRKRQLTVVFTLETTRQHEGMFYCCKASSAGL